MTNPPTTPGTEPLQFDRAVTTDRPSLVPGVVCSTCNNKIIDRYWTLGDQPTCISCKSNLQREAAKAKRFGVYGWSAFYGFGAAVAGAILYYAVLKILNLEMALVAIAIGYMVGYAMRKGANGWGGKRYQLTAVALTYLSVSMAYVPLVLEGAREAKKTAKAAADSLVAVAAATQQDSTATPDSTLLAAFDSTFAFDSAAVAADSAAIADSATTAGDTRAAPTKASIGVGAGILAVVIAFAAAFLLALSLPVIYVVSTLPGGLISALIIFFGMRQAWRMTAGTDLTFHGPLTIPK
jgi:hypothetical protein